MDVSVAGQHDWSILGKSVVKKDTMEKIMGSAKFAADMELPNMLYGGVFRSTICHGVVKNFDPSAALEIPGVVCVLTSKDIPGKNRIGIILKDEPILVDDKIRRYGDAIAVVAAETPELVRDAWRPSRWSMRNTSRFSPWSAPPRRTRPRCTVKQTSIRKSILSTAMWTKPSNTAM